VIADGFGPLTRCGIETAEITRIERLLLRPPDEDLLRIFSTGELCDAAEGSGWTASLAARCGAKEACLKLFPGEAAMGLIGLDVAVARDGYGGPRLVCSPRALELIARNRLNAIAVSPAHDRTSASAVAPAEPASPGDQAPLRAW